MYWRWRAPPPRLPMLRAAYPALDEAQWLRRVAAAQAEERGAGGGASRELFRALRELLD